MATFYIEAVENTNIALVMVGSPTIGTVKYGVNDSTCPNTYTVTTESTPISLTAGQKCYWTITSTSENFTTANYLKFTSTAKINVGGNISDLIGGETQIPRSYCFFRLFEGCSTLIDASSLVLVNDFNSKNNCYNGMFRECSSLIAIPDLLATTLTSGCYQYMFYNCRSLTVLPKLPATTLATYCYNYMFFSCRNIKLSETQTTPYSIPYRIPSEGTGAEGTSSLNNMFGSTGGTFTGTPIINTTYYLAPYATFYIEAVEDTDITLSKEGSPIVGDAYYGVENHTVPNAYTYGNTIHLTAGQKCYWFVTSGNAPDYLYDYIYFTSTAKINVGGSMSDLIGGETKIPADYCLIKLFYNCKQLVDASNLVAISNLNSKEFCYYSMFYKCTSLTAAPKLPAIILTDNCYDGMFYGCTSLTIPPELPATTLADSCYYEMFRGCTSLTTPPDILATTVDTKCCCEMFYGCSSLTTAPKLFATVLAKECYRLMFYGCTSLTIPPELPATTLADSCYSAMFSGGCVSLATLPKLPATTLENECYFAMFYGCTNIKLSETQTAPYFVPYRIPSEGTGTVGTNSLNNMFVNTGGTFKGTPTINTTYYLAPYATFYIEAVEDTDITLSKVGSPTVGDAYYGVNDHGVPNAYIYGDTIHLTAGQKCYWFITNTSTDFSSSNYLNFTSTAKINVGGNLSDLIGGETKIPRNFCFCRLFYQCTKLVDASNLVLVSDFNSKTYCYYWMFQGCTSLTIAPKLPATTPTSSCYPAMFEDCTSLTTAPTLPATTLAYQCYSSMFKGCTSLTTPPELPATTLATYCYSHMFDGCISLTTAPELPATTLESFCYYWMFYGCTSLTTPPALSATTLASRCYNSMFYGCTNIKLSETQTAPYSIPYRIPSEGTGTEGTNSLTDMFTGTGGTFKGTPTINKIYYLAPPSSPIYITYKGQELANFETGSKTIKCGGKYMEGDVIIAREIGTNNVVVLYNSATILTFQNGTKTLKCAGKGMATDLVIQTS